ncbi:MAG: hypothetical protein ACR2PK_18060 [Acidimicrobiales bacterium]
MNDPLDLVRDVAPPAEPGADSPGCDNVAVFDLRQPAETTPTTPKRRLALVGAAVAAAIVLVAGLVLVDGDSGNVVSSSGVVDDLGYRWSRVPGPDERALGGDGVTTAQEISLQSMNSVTAGGPGLVAVGWVMSPRQGSLDGAPFLAPVAAVWTSVNGISWSRVPHDETVFGGDYGQSINSVTAGAPAWWQLEYGAREIWMRGCEHRWMVSPGLRSPTTRQCWAETVSRSCGT